MKPFDFKMPSEIIFGEGKIVELPDVVKKFGKRALIITGDHSLYKTGDADRIFSMFEHHELELIVQKTSGEPTVELIDYLCDIHADTKPDVIIGIGGGSVLDTAKAMSAMLKENGSVSDYIETIGSKKICNQPIPCIAVPTTAGTGSEATNNAVIAEYLPRAFKRSLRDDALIPKVAIIDPELTLKCTSPVSPNSGIDAFCQLLEAYTSNKANSFTDAITIHGFRLIAKNIVPACTSQADNIEVRSKMAYASLLSGIGIMNSSVTVIHGFASAIGGRYEIPHGAICGAMLLGCTLMNMRKAQKYALNDETSVRFAKLGSILSGIEYDYDKHDVLLRAVTEDIKDITSKLKIQTLSQLGVRREDFYQIVSDTRLNGNPIPLTETDLTEILEMCY